MRSSLANAIAVADLRAYRLLMTIKRREFTADVAKGRVAKLRQAVRKDPDPTDSVRQTIESIYVKLWKSWPSEYTTDDNQLLLPPVDELWEASLEPESEIWEAFQFWLDNAPNVTDERILELHEQVLEGTFRFSPDDLYLLAKVFLEAHNGE